MSKGPFLANTKTNPKEYCQAITTRSGKVVGSDIGVSGDNEGADNKEENSKLKAVEEEIEKNEEESNKNEGVDNLPYPHAPSKKEKDRQFARFLDIIKKLQINIPFTEAMEQMPTYARFMKDLLTKKRRIFEEETVELEAGCSAIIQKIFASKIQRSRQFHSPCINW
ncbi:uncharacterized protein LOC109796467 [Cajanus cajan]|uniref:uncharacterized protein LOC109796467 n=1 Tax=Cajanus cajan TaxID=3821 RepID=UPI00098D99BC|nr:uncharacterized protein LOC109796467 [Cajanus cajan]